MTDVTRVPAKRKTLTLGFQWTNTNLKTKTHTCFICISKQRTNVSRAQNCAHFHDPWSFSDPGYGLRVSSCTPAPRERERLPTVPTEGCLQPAVSQGARTSQCDVLWASLLSRGRGSTDASLQEQPGNDGPDFLRRETTC